MYMSNLGDLPNELIQEILSRSNIDEIRGLCNSNSRFREHCNDVSKQWLKTNFKDMYEIYLTLNTFSISVITNEGATRFAKTNKIKNIPSILSELIRRLELEQVLRTERYDASWTLDKNNNPSTLILSYHFYDDIEKDFNIVISGTLSSYKNSEQLAQDVQEEFEKIV